MSNNKNFIVGITTFILLCILSALLLWQSKIYQEITGYQLVGRFQHIGGLIKGAEVRYRGYSVGQVKSIMPYPTHIDVVFFIKGKIKIPEGSEIKILFDGLVGENYVSIEARVGSNIMLSNNDIIIGSSGSDLAQFIDLGSQNLVHTEKILNALKTILTDETLFADIRGTVKNMNLVTEELRSYFDKSESKDMNHILNNIKSITDSSKKLTDTLATDESISAIQDTLKSMESLSSQLNNLSTVSQTILTDENATNISITIKNMRDISDNINSLLGSNRKESPHLFKSLTSLRFGTETQVLYNTSQDSGYFNTNFELGLGRYSLITGLGNKSGIAKIQHFQQSYFLRPKLRSRFGIIHDAEGIGLDYFLTKKLSFSGNYFNFNKNFYLLSTHFAIYDDLNFLLNMRNDNELKEQQLDLGLNYNF
ncbi:hypothetical protein DID78_02830 [Candidatus Marinamargulisbacteria bacterium SCGC AG-343-D04]|nr:hypothetical protein DID78_02830 [Candidatus Marinamargulisbacteria bacterium SCGC AG-343-D04]